MPSFHFNSFIFLLLVEGCAVRPLTQSTEIQANKDIGIQITKDPKDQENPAISENRIVWADYRNKNWDIYMYDLARMKKIR